MSRLFFLIFVTVSQLCAGTLRSAETTAPGPSLITAADLFNIKQIESPALSPDGRLVVYVVRSIEPKPGAKDDWVYRTQLWLAAVDGSTPPHQLSFGTAGNASPVWAPQGDRIAFVRTVEKEKPQIYLLPLAGGEAMPLTRLESGAVNPRWSPDGSRILFGSSLTYAQVRAAFEKAGKDAVPAWSNEKPGRKPNDAANWKYKPADKAKEPEPKRPAAAPDGSLQEIREWLAKDEADDNPRVTTRLNFLGEGTLDPEPDFSHLYTVEAQEGAVAEALTAGYEDYKSGAWLPDGRSIVCLGPRKASENPDRARFESLCLIDVNTGQIRTILEEASSNYGEPLPSPDGKWIACTVKTGGEYSFDQTKVAIVPAAGGSSLVLTEKLDRSAEHLRWARDSAAVYFTAPDHGRFPLFRVTLHPDDVKTLTEQPQWGIREFDVGRTGLVEVVTHPGNPWELYQGTVDGEAAKALTTHNSSWLRDRKLSAYEPHRLVNKEGITIDFWTVKPANFDPAKKYPLLVNIHGGPAAMWGPGEATSWHEMQFFAARGYAVVFGNPRGSGGGGRDFQRANFKDWGTGPASDVLAAAGFAALETYVDGNRQVLTGGSYGGYLTAWIVGHDHRFKAAVAQRGVYDLATFYGEGNAWFLLPLYFGGFPWQKEVRYVLDRESPLTYVADITTPLLIKHGDTDFRTGFVQSQLLYKSLKELGREVEYVRYPRATHELSRSGEPAQRLDRLVRYEEFFRRYIGEN